MLTNFWANPAVSTPDGREPGMRMAPRVRSRQPMARITEAHSMVSRPRLLVQDPHQTGAVAVHGQAASRR